MRCSWMSCMVKLEESVSSWGEPLSRRVSRPYMGTDTSCTQTCSDDELSSCTHTTASVCV